MKWCRFQSGDTVIYGVIDGGKVVEVAGSPFIDYDLTAKAFPLEKVKLMVPVIPPTFYAAGLKFREHITTVARERGERSKFPSQADIGYRANNALFAHGEPIVIPRDASELVQHEGELIAVIGKTRARRREIRRIDMENQDSENWEPTRFPR